jgi:hypothetical protein
MNLYKRFIPVFMLVLTLSLAFAVPLLSPFFIGELTTTYCGRPLPQFIAAYVSTAIEV